MFTIYKFRTMTVTEDCGTVRQATKGDARVTEIGALLRKLSHRRAAAAVERAEGRHVDRGAPAARPGA